MTTPTESPRVTDGDVAHSRTVTPGRVALAIVVIASFGVWGYGFSGLADRTAPDTLADPSFGELADPLCAAANETVDSLPDALDADDNVERADQVRTNTGAYTAMVDGLEGLVDDPRVTLNDRDAEITLEWLQDWRRFLADRLDYADRLTTDPDAVFYVAASSGGERLERRITRFAATNEIWSCVTPADVG